MLDSGGPGNARNSVLPLSDERTETKPHFQPFPKTGCLNKEQRTRAIVGSHSLKHSFLLGVQNPPKI